MYIPMSQEQERRRKGRETNPDEENPTEREVIIK